MRLARKTTIFGMVVLLALSFNREEQPTTRDIEVIVMDQLLNTPVDSAMVRLRFIENSVNVSTEVRYTNTEGATRFSITLNL